jgi:hypothetical protein
VFLSGFVFVINLLLTVYLFPFWKITQPLTFLTIAFLGMPLGAILLINICWIIASIKKITKSRDRRKIVTFLFSANLFILIALIVGINQALYQMNPINNFNYYVKEREEIVTLIQSGKLATDGNRALAEGYSRQTIQLPSEYKGLSWGGKIDVDREPSKLKIRFTHSTIGFGDRSRDFIYYRSDNDQSSVPYPGVKKLKEHWFYSY